jgi:DNA-binding CsgD family transcriptional regulator
MNLFGFTLSLAIVSLFFNSIYTFCIDISSKANRIFSFTSFIIFLWFVCYVIFAPADVAGSPTAFHQFLVYLYYFICAATLHFGIAFTKNRSLNKKWIIIPAYLPSVYFTLKGIKVLLFASSQQWLSGTWIEQENSQFPLFQLYSLICIIVMGTHLLNFYIWGKKSSSNREKKQAKLFFAGYLICYAIMGSINLFTPVFKNWIFPVINLNIMYITTWIFTVITIKYKFMSAVPPIVSEEILNNIHETVALLDRDLNIIEINRKFKDSLHLETMPAEKKSFTDFIENAVEFKRNTKDIISGKNERLFMRINYKKNSGSILMDSSVSGVMDKYSDLIGVLVISSENKGREQMLLAYRLTEREFEIVELSINGLSNREIGKKLNISKRTVETHLLNVYNKLGVMNKIELLNIAHSFNLIRKDYPAANGFHPEK